MISFVLTGQLTYNLLISFKKNPIVIYTEEKTVDVRDIFFPALTFCPGLILSRTNLTKLEYDKISEDLMKGGISIGNLTDYE